MELSNADFQQIFNENPYNLIEPDDIFILFKNSTGKTGGILGKDILGVTDLTALQWNSTASFDTGDPTVYAGQWWISLIDANVGNIPTEGANWTQENKITAIVAKPWAAGIYENHYSIVTDGATIYRVKPSVVLPFNSQTTPSADATNWEAIGGGGGSGDMLKSVYDPTSKNASAFDMDQMDQGSTNKYVIQNQIDIISAVSTFKGSYADLSALNTAHPSGASGEFAHITGEKWFRYWAGSSWEVFGQEYISRHIYISSDDAQADDLNDGSNGGAPVRTWQRVNELVQPNSVIHVARESVFTISDFPTDLPFGGALLAGSFPTSLLPIAIGHGVESKWNNVKIIPYGTGKRWKIDLRYEVVKGVDITKEGGYTNVYKAVFTRVHSDVNPNTTYGGLWENNYYLEEVFNNHPNSPTGENAANLAAALTYIDANPGTFLFNYTEDPDNNVYYFHTTNSTSPITNPLVYKTRYFDFAFARDHGGGGGVDRAEVLIQGCEIIGNAHHNGAVYGENIHLKDVHIIQAPRHGLMVQGVLEDVRIFEPQLSAWGGYDFHGFPFVPGVRMDGTKYIRCEVIGFESSPNIGGFGSHAQAGSTNGQLEFIDCKVSNRTKVYDFQEGIERIIRIGGLHENNKAMESNLDAGAAGCITTVNGETYISSRGFQRRQLIKDDNIHKFYNCRLAWDSDLQFQIQNGDAAELHFYNCILVMNGAADTEGFLRLLSNGSSPLFVAHNCVIVNLDPTALELIEVESGSGFDSDKLDIDNCYLFNITVGGSTSPAAINGTYSAFTLNNVLENTTQPFISDPFTNEWGINPSSNAAGIIKEANKSFIYGEYNIPSVPQSTPADVTPPTFSSAPSSDNIAETSFDIDAQINENGTIYAVVVANGATAPTPAEVKAGTGSGGSGELATDSAADSGSGVTLNLTGLSGLTQYDCYVIAEDDSSNLQTSVTLVEVTTLAGAGEDADATSWLDSLTATPTAAERTAVDNLVKQLKLDNNWSELFDLRVYTQSPNMGEEAALRDFTNERDAVKDAGVDWEPDKGMNPQGVAFTKIDLNWNPETSGFDKDNSSMGIMYFETQSNDSKGLGHREGSGFPDLYVQDDISNNRIVWKSYGNSIEYDDGGGGFNMTARKLYSWKQFALESKGYEGGTELASNGDGTKADGTGDHFDLTQRGLASIVTDGFVMATFRGTKDVDLAALETAINDYYNELYPAVTLADLEPYFDYAHPAPSALKSGDVAITDGAPAIKLVDTIGGLSSLEYTGSGGQRTGFTSPIYKDDGGNNKYLEFPNLNDVIFTHPGSISPADAPPITMLLVIMQRKGENFESVMKTGGGGFNVKDNNGNWQFDRNTGTGASTDAATSGPDYKISANIITFENGSESWFKNSYLNDIYNSGNVTASVNFADDAIGVSTNVMEYNYYGRWLKVGTFTTKEVQEIISICRRLWTLDVAIHPDAENLTTEWDSGSKEWYVSADGGSSEWTPPGGSSIKWVECKTSKSFSDQDFIVESTHSTGSPGDATSFRLARGDYDILFPNNDGTDLVWLYPIITIPGFKGELRTRAKRDNIA